MSFRVSFFPIPYIVVLILVIAFVATFNEAIYTYFIASVDVNGIIVSLVIFCNIWILGSLAYFSRSARLLSKILADVGPVVEKQSIKKALSKDRKPKVLKSSYSVAGTLFDTPIFSSVLAKLDRKNKLEVSRSDADEIAQSMLDNAQRVLSPSKFLASIFVLLGLIGTFFGLLSTIGGVAKALNTLAQGGGSTDIGEFIKLLSDPLQGMSIAFSASLFGLSSALISNFGNHMAWQRVLNFTFKVRNYLIANTGVFDEDPTRISVRDLLVSLEESFDMLYRGITNKLEDLTGHISTMSSIIVKTHERQERMLRVILKDHELMEQFWKKFLLSEKGIMSIVDNIANRLSVLLPESIRKVFAPVLEEALDIMDKNSDMLEKSLAVAQESVAAQGDIVVINDEISKSIRENNSMLSQINDELGVIYSKVNLDQVASLIAESNSIAKESNNINLELLDVTEHNAGSIEQVKKTLSDTNAIIVDIRSINEQSNSSLQYANSLAEEALNIQAAGNEISTNILTSTNDNNVIADETLEFLGKVLEESSNISKTILYSVNEIAQHNINIVKILDERFAMIVAFSSDLLSSTNNISMLLNGMSDSLVNYYQHTDNHFASLNGSVNNLVELNGTGLSILDATANNSRMIVEKLDNSNEIAINTLRTSSETLGGVAAANDTLQNIFALTAKSFPDVANFSALCVNIERQINILLGSFLEFKDHFNSYKENALKDSQTLNNVNNLSSDMASRLQVVGDLLHEIVISLGNLNSISSEHKDLSFALRESVSNIISQNDTLNSSIVTLGTAFEKGFNKVIEGMELALNNSSSYSQAIGELLDNIVANLSLLSQISGEITNISKTNKEQNDILDKVDQKLESSIEVQKNHEQISDEIKNILVNADANITGIGNLVNSISYKNDESVEKLNTLVESGASNKEYQKNIQEFTERAEKSLEQLAGLINNLNEVQNQYGNEVKNNFTEVIKGINSINALSESVSKIISEINTSITSIEKDKTSIAVGEALEVVKSKLSNLVSMKEAVIKDFDNILKPKLQNFDNNFSTIVERLSNLSDVADKNQELLSTITQKDNTKMLTNLESVNKALSGVGQNFKDLSDYLASLTSRFDDQKTVIGNINTEVKNIRIIADNFKSVPSMLNNTTSVINSINKTLTTLDSNTTGISKSIVTLSEDLSKDLKSILDIVNGLGGGLKDEAAKLNDWNFEICESLDKLVHGLSDLTKDLKDNADNNHNNNDRLIREINKSFKDIASNLTEVKSSISSAISNQIVAELDKISGNQQEISYRVEQVMPYISELIKAVNNIASKNMSSELIQVTNALEEISNANINNNTKLDLLIKSANTLVSEMLNSRNVSQAILDIIAELGGFKRVK